MPTMDESKRASFFLLPLLGLFLLGAVLPGCAAHDPRMLFLVKPDPIVLQDHHGALLTGNLTVNILYYGRFAAAQRAIIAEFVRSLSAPATRAAPSVASWWRVTSLYRGGGARLRLGRQLLDERMSLGRSLSLENVTALARGAGHHRGAITAVLTAPDVLVAPFCTFRCGLHGHASAGAHGRARYAYLWAGNPAQQCPGQCAWPFARPTYGPQTPPLVSPSGDVGMDGVVITLAALLAGTVTNPYGAMVLPGRPGDGGRHGVHRRLRQRRLPRLPGDAPQGPCHRRELQRRRDGRAEVPAPGALGPDHVQVQDACVDALWEGRRA
uniref:Uncharacterized protein n=1 Tax=Avena sativa TaxID=4498 RepID=A0ACD5V9C6_AVESA